MANKSIFGPGYDEHVHRLMGKPNVAAEKSAAQIKEEALAFDRLAQVDERCDSRFFGGHDDTRCELGSGHDGLHRLADADAPGGQLVEEMARTIGKGSRSWGVLDQQVAASQAQAQFNASQSNARHYMTVPASADFVLSQDTWEIRRVAAPPVLEWCRCGCGGEGRCLEYRTIHPCEDDAGSRNPGILAMMRSPL